MSRVLVDLLFYTGTKGGMESYAREVYSRLSPDDPDLEYVGLASRELAATDTSWFPGRVVDSGISGEDRVAWARGELFSLGGAARRQEADLVHCPANFGPLAVGRARGAHRARPARVPAPRVRARRVLARPPLDDPGRRPAREPHPHGQPRPRATTSCAISACPPSASW